MKPAEQKKLCKNIFKNGEKIDKSQFNQRWVELINKFEKSKETIIKPK